jgi:Ca2+-binding EF-hand superfamily protein
MTRFMYSLMVFVAAAFGAAPESAQTADKTPTDDVRDAILLLQGGPLHVRLKVSLGSQSLAEARRAYTERLLKLLDANGDGKLSRDEASKSPLLRVKQRESAKEFLKSLGINEQTLGQREIAQEVDRLGGETVAYRQDGSASAPDQEVFKFLDQNGDGVIDGVEISAAAERLIIKDEDRDQCITFDEFAPPPPPPDPNQPIIQPPSRPAATTSNLLRDLRDPLLAPRLIQQYDRNRNRTLDAAELGWTAERLALLDSNQDGRLDVRELEQIRATPIDLELAVDLAPSDGQQPAIRVLTTGAERLDNQDRPDFAKVRFRDAVITVSHRHIDPFAKTMETAMQVFNRLDVDNNGYLDAAEVKDSIRFERGLFELMDADGDGKVFGDEMKQYVSVRSEPAATSCRVNLYDTGFGFFLALDRNGDGRISERERRGMFAALSELNRDGKPGITAQEPVRHFHIELVRGTYTLFGAPDQLIVQTPAFQRRPPIGPSWFQALDRNNDGDVSWEEFLLSSRQEFDHIDADGDGLIDPNEAAKADEEYENGRVATSR